MSRHVKQTAMPAGVGSVTENEESAIMEMVAENQSRFHGNLSVGV